MFCAKCGAVMTDSAAFCPACGTPAAASAGTPAPAATVAVALPQRYAGFWLRAAAYVVDSFLLSLVTFPLMLGLMWPAFHGFARQLSALGNNNNVPPDQALKFMAPLFARMMLAGLAAALIQWIYYAACESSSWQATPGKKLLNLRVTDLTDQRQHGRASGRIVAMLALGLVPLGFVGYILAGFTERKQALQDIIAGCLVLRA